VPFIYKNGGTKLLVSLPDVTSFDYKKPIMTSYPFMKVCQEHSQELSRAKVIQGVFNPKIDLESLLH